ncbi:MULTISPECIES: carboxymuconolactone decarboxylase family protein [unclassified Polaribacter]|uniref:carboxymuconolactone decarboxylase family protein n=1 Tax=unclassified Polaribacter TaxID=196858 RepID=UPI001C4F67C0|nr:MULTISPECIES: carboxymuconolactone decarboxylase family protein [unclassified Polaribacter]QXP63598.1 carboxymuconolactone decarboxylase family protein [Polaribacter sp. HaHaR_3_91]QXP66105.1 carboxymuconolactone decarboxylase family protein [Polaribacter sp. AHE13PA]QXP71593.1 carboxymuconolactone decarboxylase family protein [Polaribacter sp. R2A056_3_33]
MSTFNVPTKNEVSENNQAIFNQLEKGLGFVPNLYAAFAHSETALGNFLAIGQGKTSFSAKEKEVINLAVSQVNECVYCLSAHTAIGKMNGFTEPQILELRAGEASFDAKLDALAKFSRSVSLNRGAATTEAIENLYAAGYTKGNLADAIILIGEITITNYFHKTTDVAVDFPVAQTLEVATI